MIDIFLSVRNKSERLPGKSLLKINGKTITEHIIRRLEKSGRVVLCTSTNILDDALIDVAKKCNIEAFRGSESDKLLRYRDCARKFRINHIVIVDGDDLFCETSFIEKCCKLLNHADYTSVIGAPTGTVPFCVKMEALEKVCYTKTSKNTELWTHYLTESNLFSSKFLDVTETKLHRPDIRLTLDYAEDWKLIQEIVKLIGKEPEQITLEEIIKLFDSMPELSEINRDCQRRYLENQKKMINSD